MIRRATKTTAGGLIPAAAYYRVSTDKQETSIDDQRTHVVAYAAAHGYSLVEEYIDDGISGDKTEKRASFQRMIRDAEERGAFNVILCWDQDRFGRFDSIEAGRWIHPLRSAGVRLETIAQGAIDWTDFAGRLIYQVQQEGKHSFLVDISKNTARGQIKMARAGGRNARAPWGYDRMLIDEAGSPRVRVRRGEQVPKPKGWRSGLVKSETDVPGTIGWMFKTYASGQSPMRELATLLEQKGISSPNGVPWSADMVRAILKNPIYTGDSVWGRRSTGSYHQVVGGEIVRLQNPLNHPTTHGSESWIVVKDAHEPIVDRETFEEVQKRMVANRAYTGPQKETYLLTGLCHCGHCAATMHGWRKTWKNRKVGDVVHKSYVCNSYARFGKRGGCGHHAVYEQPMVEALVRKLREAVFAGGNWEKLLEQFVQRENAQAKAAPEIADRHKERIAELDRQIDQAADRVLRAPEDLVDMLTDKLIAMRDERRRLAAELEADNRKTAPKATRSDPEAHARRLWSLHLQFDKADPKTLRELLRRMVSRIDLWFERQQSGKKEFTRCVRGVVSLRPDPDLWGTDGADDFESAQHSSTCFP
ncbi:MAG: recombinase family protein [Pirellulales bacterium]